MPALRAIENIPGNHPDVERARPRIIENVPLPNRIRILPALFKKGRRVPPPANNIDKRDQILCNKCKKFYKDEFCKTCVILKWGFKSDLTPPDNVLEYVPLTDSYIDHDIN